MKQLPRRRNGGANGRVGRPTRVHGVQTRCNGPYHPEGAHVRTHRWHRGGRDDVAAGVARRRPQLGLPLLLATRRSLSLDALMAAGYVEEATSWRNWMLRAVAGDPDDLQIMYGIPESGD